MNVGSEEVSDINSTEIEEALSQLKHGRAPGEDKITKEMIKLGSTTTMASMKILVNKVFTLVIFQKHGKILKSSCYIKRETNYISATISLPRFLQTSLRAN